MRVRGQELYEAEHPQHFACFDCRKTFKRGSGHPSDNDESLRAVSRAPAARSRWPRSAGISAAAPAETSGAQWLKVELLHSFGIIFEVPVMEAGGPGERPSKLNEALAFLMGARV